VITTLGLKSINNVHLHCPVLRDHFATAKLQTIEHSVLSHRHHRAPPRSAAQFPPASVAPPSQAFEMKTVLKYFLWRNRFSYKGLQHA